MAAVDSTLPRKGVFGGLFNLADPSFVCAYACVRVSKYVFMHVCVCACARVCAHCAYACMCVFVCMCVHTYDMYAYVHADECTQMPISFRWVETALNIKMERILKPILIQQTPIQRS